MQQFLPPSTSQQVEETQPQPTQKLQIIQGLHRWSAYLFWFSLGVTAIHVSRLIPNSWVLYLVFILSVIGYLLFVVPDKASEDIISLRRVSSAAVILSAIAYWDGLLLLVNLPITIGKFILPAWLVAVIAIVSVVFLVTGVDSAAQR